MAQIKSVDTTVDNSEELLITGNDEEQIYPIDGIKVDKGFYTVFELKRRYDANPRRIILDSDFQRSDVWNSKKKAELVESVLMGLPLPVFYFNQNKKGALIVVDGRQRLTALFEFIDNKFQLKNLKIMNRLNGMRFKDLSSVYQSKLEDYQIQAHVILPPTPDRLKFDIFDRVNRGGTQLNKQEIRNALYQGKATGFLNTIVKGKEFANATGNAFAKEKRMRDRYLINRFVTFFLYWQGKLTDEDGKPYIYNGDIEGLLGKGLDYINDMNEGDIQHLELKINTMLEASFNLLGKNVFRLNRIPPKSPVNMNVFETVMFVFLYSSNKAYEKSDSFRESVYNFIDGMEFRDNIGNHRDSVAKLHWRLEAAEKLGRLF